MRYVGCQIISKFDTDDLFRQCTGTRVSNTPQLGGCPVVPGMQYIRTSAGEQMRSSKSVLGIWAVYATEGVLVHCFGRV